MNNPGYASQPKLKRGGKFLWLLEMCREAPVFDRLAELLAWADPGLWAELRINGHHEEQAGLLCALTAVSVWQGKYVAAGEPVGGYFFLPPWPLWQNWAKNALNANRQKVQPALEVWIDGIRHERDDQLP